MSSSVVVVTRRPERSTSRSLGSRSARDARDGWGGLGLVAGLVGGLGAIGCGDTATITVDGDRSVPAELDAMCLGVADRAPGGGSFGRTYRLLGRLGWLPQTLVARAGGAGAATAWARGYRAGVVVAGDRADLSFAADVTLRLDRCPRATAGPPVRVAALPVPASALAGSQGQGGTIVVAVTFDGAQRIAADGDTLRATPAPELAGHAVVAFDADRDCDDDLAVVSADAVTVWRRDGASFVAGARLAGAAQAVVAFDVDGDDDQDLVIAGGATATLYLGDGTGGFTAAPAGALAVGGALTDVRALAAGDLDGDGHPDLVIGQNGAPPRVFLGDRSGAGVLSLAPTVLPPVALDVRGLVIADLDRDGDTDLLATVAGGPTRLFINRGGLLEQQGFVRLPDAPEGPAAAVGDWDGDCAADLVVAGATTTLLRGGADGVFTTEASLAGASAALLVDLDDDGDPDLVTASATELAWYRR